MSRAAAASKISDGRSVRLQPRGQILRAADMATVREAEELRRVIAAERAQAQAAATAARKDAVERGYRDGYERGAAKASAYLAQIAAQHAQRTRAAEAQLTELVCHAVERVIGNMDQGAAAQRAIEHGVQALLDSGKVRVCVHPARVETVRAGLLNAGLPVDDTLSVVADPSLDERRCVAESALGYVELGLDEQLSALTDGLRAAMRDGEAV